MFLIVCIVNFTVDDDNGDILTARRGKVKRMTIGDL